MEQRTLGPFFRSVQHYIDYVYTTLRHVSSALATWDVEMRLAALGGTPLYHILFVNRTKEPKVYLV